ncbi:MAG TPA: putative quinol monooxygenase, partial [Methylomirabilota bacterium]|nr:putative quinol monooxygenase [Methylomirabilota bacterium]
ATAGGFAPGSSVGGPSGGGRRRAGSRDSAASNSQVVAASPHVTPSQWIATATKQTTTGSPSARDGPSLILHAVRRESCDTAAMPAAFGMNVRFTARPGQAGALIAMLLKAAEGAREPDDCRLYVVSRSPADGDSVWVTEAWTSQEAHDASLEDERARTMIQRALTLLAGPPEAIELTPIGGKGLERTRRARSTTISAAGRGLARWGLVSFLTVAHRRIMVWRLHLGD